MGLTANTGPYNAAAEYFGADDLIMSKIPRKKFNFSVEIGTIFGGFTFHRVQGVSLPDYNYNTVSYNQYNRQRYVHTRVEPTPAGITFYDTVDNQFQDMLRDYANYYSHGHQVSEQTMMTYDTVTDGFDGSFGIKPVSTTEKYFFPVIIIKSQDLADSYRSIVMYNCMITNVQHDRLDYSDSSPVIWTVQIQPEHVNFDTGNVSNGATSSGVNAPTKAYDVAKSAAAGVLVDAVGNIIRNAGGQSINISSIANFGTTATSNQFRIAVDSAGRALTDTLGNPVVVGSIIANAAGINPTVGAVAGAVASGAINTKTIANAANTFAKTGIAQGFNRIINSFF